MNKCSSVVPQHHRTGRLFFLCLTFLAGLLSAAGVSAADGGISLGQTRVIFDSSRKSEKVTVNNQSDRVYLINSRVFRTPDGSAGGTDALPFMVTPPLFRLESNSRNTVLVMRNDTSALPADRESVFYLSFLSIPAVTRPLDTSVADGAMQPRLSVGIRSVIKLFYRPQGLVMTSAEAPERLTFSLNGNTLHAENPTPYYLTLASLQIGSSVVDVREQGAMIPPYAGRDYRITGSAGEVSWAVIDDYGTFSRTYHSAVSQVGLN